MNQVRINLQFGDALLPIVKNEAGQDVVPLKPICDVIGLKWETQRVKVQDSYLTKRLGIATPPMGGGFPANQEPLCIRLDRVAAFLYTINPDRVRVNGNETAADYLERKHTEWDDLLHQYEAQNGQLIQQATSAKIVNIRAFVSVSREMRMVEDKKLRCALGAMAGSLAHDVGIPYQPDLLDATGS